MCEVVCRAIRQHSCQASAASEQRERWYRERSSIKARRFGLVSTEFRDVFFESNLSEQRGDFRAKTSCSSILFVYSISENVPDFFLHAPSMPRCSPLQPYLNVFLDISYDKLGHVSSVFPYDIMISSLSVPEQHSESDGSTHQI